MRDGHRGASNRGRDRPRVDRLPVDICVWSGGLRSPPVASLAGAGDRPARPDLGRPNLRSISHPHIIAVGDAAHPVAPTGAPYRLSAFVAIAIGRLRRRCRSWRRSAKRQLEPFSFSTFGQGIAIGRGGVGFPSYPDDRQRWFILTGQRPAMVRNSFVWFITYTLKLERRMPGFFFWPGRRRVIMAAGKRSDTTGPDGTKGLRRRDARSRLRRAASGDVRAGLPHHRQPGRRRGDRAGRLRAPARGRAEGSGALAEGLSRDHHRAAQPQSPARPAVRAAKPMSANGCRSRS